MTPVLVYSAPAWREQLQRDRGPRRRMVLRHRGNVSFLPPPVVGYRIRHDGGEAVVEIKPSRAPAMPIARCSSVEAARRVLADVMHQHRRPVLREIGKALGCHA